MRGSTGLWLKMKNCQNSRLSLWKGPSLWWSTYTRPMLFYFFYNRELHERYRAVQWLHIVCLYLHCQPEVRGWRPAKCKALGRCHDSWQLGPGRVCSVALLTAKIPDQVNPNHRVSTPLMWKFTFLLGVFHVQKGAHVIWHKALGLPSVTDYCNEELKSPNTKEPAAHCFRCQN